MISSLPYVNDITSPSHNIDLGFYAGVADIIVTSRKPTMIVSYLESYLNDLQCRLSVWRIVINVSKSTAIFIT